MNVTYSARGLYVSYATRFAGTLPRRGKNRCRRRAKLWYKREETTRRCGPGTRRRRASKGQHIVVIDVWHIAARSRERPDSPVGSRRSSRRRRCTTTPVPHGTDASSSSSSSSSVEPAHAETRNATRGRTGWQNGTTAVISFAREREQGRRVGDALLGTGVGFLEGGWVGRQAGKARQGKARQGGREFNRRAAVKNVNFIVMAPVSRAQSRYRPLKIDIPRVLARRDGWSTRRREREKMEFRLLRNISQYPAAWKKKAKNDKRNFFAIFA